MGGAASLKLESQDIKTLGEINKSTIRTVSVAIRSHQNIMLETDC